MRASVLANEGIQAKHRENKQAACARTDSAAAARSKSGYIADCEKDENGDRLDSGTILNIDG